MNNNKRAELKSKIFTKKLKEEYKNYTIQYFSINNRWCISVNKNDNSQSIEMTVTPNCFYNNFKDNLEKYLNGKGELDTCKMCHLDSYKLTSCPKCGLIYCIECLIDYQLKGKGIFCCVECNHKSGERAHNIDIKLLESVLRKAYNQN
tara:strand:- start:1455 stop:1898 length:444 start_codon:yes stop_codon:yes gene_type:complete